jgi:integrase
MKNYRVAELIERFLAHHKMNSKPGTFKFYERIRRFKSGILRIADLKPLHVTEWVEGTMDNYRRNLMRAMKTCFKWCCDQGYIETSPLAKMKLPSAVSRSDEAYILPEQWQKIITAVDDLDLFDLLTLLYETGARPGEIRLVESKHFDRAGRMIIYQKIDSKGKQFQRIIHLNDIAMAIIERRVSVQTSGLLFSSFSPTKLDTKCSQLVAKIGVKFVPYSLRHTFATRAILAGVDLETIAVLLGHCDLKMLTKIYSHIRRQGDFIKAGLEKMSI